MSLQYTVFSSRFLLSFCAVLCLTLLGFTPQQAVAQTGIGGGVPVYTVVGSSTRVTPAGGIPGQVGESACPFADRDMGKIQQAFAASDKSIDPDSCPYAKGADGRIRWFRYCRGIYHELSRIAADVDSPEQNMYLIGCHLPPGERRNRYRAREKGRDFALNAEAGYMYKSLGVIPEKPGRISAETAKKMRENQQKLREANMQCFDDSLNRITEYWAKQRGVSCIRYIQGAIKRLMKANIRDLKNSMLEKTTTGLSNTGPVGAMTAIFQTPSITGLVSSFGAVVNFAAEVVTVADEATSLLNTLSEECGNVVPQLKELQEWRQSALGGACRAVMNLVERQLTQCIRVNIGASAALRLPQFNVALQCPVNINFQARLTPRGFDCFGGVSAGSPIIANNGRRSLLGGNGGLENLFEGKCFTSPSSRVGGTAAAGGTGSTGIGGSGDPATDRVPGVDCGPLDPNPAKQVEIKGMTVLTQGRTLNGWAVGGSETVNGQQITRCDFYNAGSLVRSNYVFGNGSTCSGNAGGFLSGGYETNTACYPGRYTPFTAPSIPDACMYPIECLDASGTFDATRGGACTTAKPSFDASRTYNTFISGGIGAAAVVGRSCSDFSAPTDAKKLMCCDPQKQDCRKKDADTPLCACDEGDSNNQIKVDLLTGAADVNGMCVQGGQKTCCSPRLNGGREMCASMGMPICEDGLTDMCVDSTILATYKGPDGIDRHEVELSSGRVEKFTVIHAVQSKPSPYIYLFIRPDVTLATGEQCCTTEWCNICPQHYVNAYGLSLKRDDVYSNPTSDADNRRIIGEGWPYQIVNEGDDSDADSTAMQASNDDYLIGIKDVKVLNFYVGKQGKEKEYELPAAYAPLHLSSMLKQPADLGLCNRTTKLEAKVVPMQNFPSSDAMGWTYNQEKKKRRAQRWQVVAGVPTPMLYPIDHLNAQRRAIKDADGTPLPPIQLCGEMEICLPPESGTVLNLDARVSHVRPSVALGSGILDRRGDLPAARIPSSVTPTTPTLPGTSGTAPSTGGVMPVAPMTPGLSGGTFVPATPSVTPTVPGVRPATPGSGPTPMPPAGSGSGSGSGAGLAPASPIGLF